MERHTMGMRRSIPFRVYQALRSKKGGPYSASASWTGRGAEFSVPGEAFAFGTSHAAEEETSASSPSRSWAAHDDGLSDVQDHAALLKPCTRLEEDAAPAPATASSSPSPPSPAEAQEGREAGALPDGTVKVQCSVCLEGILLAEKEAADLPEGEGKEQPATARDDSAHQGTGTKALQETESGPTTPQNQVLFAHDGMPYLALKCGHKFHKACAESWLKEHNTCPNCRKVVAAAASVPKGFDRRRYFSPSLVTAAATPWSNLRESTTSEGVVHLDFALCALAKDKFVISHIRKHGPRLERLEVGTTRITKQVVKEVYKHCPNITWLDVSHCTSLEARTFTKLMERCTKLETLIVSYCGLDDRALLQIAGAPYGTTSGLKHLVTLDVAGNDRITDKGVSALVRCEKLQTLRFGYCLRISDVCFSALLPRVRNLRVLNVRGCRRLSMRCIHTVISNLLCLEKLDIVGCSIDGNEAAGTMVRQMYSLKEILSADNQSSPEKRVVDVSVAHLCNSDQTILQADVNTTMGCDGLSNDVIISGEKGVQGLRNRVVF